MKLTISLLVFGQFLAICWFPIADGYQNVTFGSRMDGDSLLYTARRKKDGPYRFNNSPSRFGFNYALVNEVFTSKSNPLCFLRPQITYIEVLDESKGVNGAFATIVSGGVESRQVKMSVYSKSCHPLDVTVNIYGIDKRAFELKCKPSNMKARH